MLDLNNNELILKDLEFFSPNGKLNKKIFHYEREVMLILKNGDILKKNAFYSHGLAIDVIFSSYFDEEKIRNKYKNNCIKMCELLALDGNIMMVIENNSCVVCVPRSITDKQVNILFDEFNKFDINDNNIEFYVWKCIDDRNVYDVINSNNIIIGGYEFNQEKIDINYFKKYLKFNFIKKRR